MLFKMDSMKNESLLEPAILAFGLLTDYVLQPRWRCLPCGFVVVLVVIRRWKGKERLSQGC